MSYKTWQISTLLFHHLSFIVLNWFLLPAEKFRRVLNSFLNFRDEQETKLKNESELELGDVTTVNLTMVRGELKNNFEHKCYSKSNGNDIGRLDASFAAIHVMS